MKEMQKNMTREEYRRSVKSGGMYTTRDVYGNPRFIIHFLDLVHEDHPETTRTKWNRPAGWRTSTAGDGTAAEYSAVASSSKPMDSIA